MDRVLEENVARMGEEGVERGREDLNEERGAVNILLGLVLDGCAGRERLAKRLACATPLAVVQHEAGLAGLLHLCDSIVQRVPRELVAKAEPCGVMCKWRNKRENKEQNQHQISK